MADAMNYISAAGGARAQVLAGRGHAHRWFTRTNHTGHVLQCVCGATTKWWISFNEVWVDAPAPKPKQPKPEITWEDDWETVKRFWASHTNKDTYNTGYILGWCNAQTQETWTERRYHEAVEQWVEREG